MFPLVKCLLQWSLSPLKICRPGSESPVEVFSQEKTSEFSCKKKNNNKKSSVLEAKHRQATKKNLITRIKPIAKQNNNNNKELNRSNPLIG